MLCHLAEHCVGLMTFSDYLKIIGNGKYLIVLSILLCMGLGALSFNPRVEKFEVNVNFVPVVSSLTSEYYNTCFRTSRTIARINSGEKLREFNALKDENAKMNVEERMLVVSGQCMSRVMFLAKKLSDEVVDEITEKASSDILTLSDSLLKLGNNPTTKGAPPQLLINRRMYVDLFFQN